MNDRHSLSKGGNWRKAKLRERERELPVGRLAVRHHGACLVSPAEQRNIIPLNTFEREVGGRGKHTCD